MRELRRNGATGFCRLWQLTTVIPALRKLRLVGEGAAGSKLASALRSQPRLYRKLCLTNKTRTRER